MGSPWVQVRFVMRGGNQPPGVGQAQTKGWGNLRE